MGLIPEETIVQVLDRADIVEVVSKYIPLKRAGRNFKAPCPFHNEKTPSFVVSPDKQIFHCFGCNAGGNVVSFVMKQEHVAFPEAIRMLAQKSGITIPESEPGTREETSLRQQIYSVNKLALDFFHQNLLSGNDAESKKAVEYLKRRQVSLETAKELKLGIALDQWDALIGFLRKKGISQNLIEKAGLIIARQKGDGFYDRFRNRIIFPIFDSKSQCVAFGARAMEEDQSAKYLNSPETDLYIKGNHLYGFYLTKNEIGRMDEVVIVEGYMDFVIPFQAGVKNVAASLGTALTVEQIRLLRRYTKNVTMLFDGDQAGEAAMVRSLDLLIEEGMHVKVASLPEGDDPDSFICQHGLEGFQERLSCSDSIFDYKLKNLKKRFDFENGEQRAEIASGMMSTIEKFDNEVIKATYLKKLAAELLVSEETLSSEYTKQSQSSTPRRRFSSKEQDLQPVNRLIQTAEGNVLRLLLEDPDLIEPTRQEVDLCEFRDDRLKAVMTKVFELFDQKQEVSSAALMNYFSDQSILDVLSELMLSEKAVIIDKRKMHRDCINRLKNDTIKSQRKNLLGQIELAENSGDDTKLDQLKIKLNELVKR